MTDMVESTRIYVGGLSYALEDKGLLDMFKDFGQIANAEVVCDRNTRKSRGYGFVTFQNPGSAAKAMSHMNGREVEGRILVVNSADPVKSHPTPGGPGFMPNGGRGQMGQGGMNGGPLDSDPFLGFPGNSGMGPGMGGMNEMGGYGGYMRGGYGRGGFGRGRFGGRFGGRGYFGGRFGGYKVLITGLAPTVDWRTLKDYLRQGGNVTFASTKFDGTGVGEFATLEDAQNACQQLDGSELLGSIIGVRQMTSSEMNSMGEGDMGGFRGRGFRGGFMGRGRYDGYMGRGRFGYGPAYGMPNQRYQPY
eukprot:TRINITY_DN6520_c3_g1_i1.p2 TRINITY_DN6520_c3_g1~~TRINITY_DN6520_c3_g1_i1.p2  ORF type:complete len:357 (-),score=54.53 TRINITY_DN6520_c3_g1_i1:339-1253(-)